MTGPLAPRRRSFPELLSALVVYALIAIGSYIVAQRSLSGEPDFLGLEERLPAAILAILPLALLALFLLRARSLIIDLRSRRYGSRLRLRLSALFLLAIGAASAPQGFILIRLAAKAQSSASAREIRDALVAGQDVALSWHDEELGRLARAASELTARAGTSGSATLAASLLRLVQARDPRMQALEIFAKGRSTSFAGASAARLATAPEAPAPGSVGYLLPAASSGSGSSLLRYATPLGSVGSFAVLSLRLPDGLEPAAAVLGSATRDAEFLAPSSERWRSLLLLLYCFLVLPLLLVAALLGLVAADLVAEPLTAIEDATRRVGAGDYGVRLIVKPGDETGRLVASFNRMLGEIQRYRVDELRKEKIDAWKDIAQRLAHELKNPLTPIRLAAERVLRKWRTDPGQAATIIEGSMLAIVKEVEGMDALLGDFRAFASLPQPQRDWVSLRGLVEESIALFAASYPEVAFILGDLPESTTLLVDRSAMKRVLGNLLANSIDAMERRGRIEIAADLVKASDSRYCRLRIRDTGKGIPAIIGDKIFTPYFTTKKEGTGLGLPIVERIIADHGGSIRFESAEGAGTTFYVDIPLDR